MVAGGALFFWPDLDDEPAASAQEVVESACANLAAAKDYDGTSSMTVTQDGVDKGDTMYGNFEVSGPDFRNVVKLLNAGTTWEQVYVDGKGYMRDAYTNHEWQEAYYPLGAANEALTMLGDTPTCPDLTNVTKVGDEVLNGVAVSKYTSGDGKPAPLADDFRGSKRGDLLEYWVDGRGQLLQIYNEHYIAAHYEGQRRGQDDRRLLHHDDLLRRGRTQQHRSPDARGVGKADHAQSHPVLQRRQSMRVRTALVFVLGIVVLAGGALFFWPDLDDEPPASAQVVVESACESLEKARSYDMSATLKGSGNGVPWPAFTFKAQVSGSDYQSSLRATDGSGEDIIRIGDTDYERSLITDGSGGVIDEGWQISNTKLRDVDSWLGALGDSPICPDVSDVLYLGEEQLDGVKVSHYASGDVDGSQKKALDALESTYEGHVEVHEYWVNVDGQLVQHRLEIHSLSQGPGVERRVTSAIGFTKFLNVGEPNVITAPTIP